MTKYSNVFFLYAVFILMFVCASQAKLRKEGSGIMTWYSFEDNASTIGSFDNTLKPFASVAVKSGGRIRMRSKLYIPKLRGFPIGNGKRHNGWVRVDDVCKGSACRYLDLYVGTNKQRDLYRKWMRARCACDPDQLMIVAYRM